MTKIQKKIQSSRVWDQVPIFAALAPTKYEWRNIFDTQKYGASYLFKVDNKLTL